MNKADKLNLALTTVAIVLVILIGYSIIQDMKEAQRRCIAFNASNPACYILGSYVFTKEKYQEEYQEEEIRRQPG